MIVYGKHYLFNFSFMFKLLCIHSVLGGVICGKELLLKFGRNKLHLLPLPTPKIKTIEKHPFHTFHQ